MTGAVRRALAALFERGSGEAVEHDPEWPSPCEVLPADDRGMVRWRLVAMEPPAGFEGVGLRPELVELFGSFWGGDVHGRHSGETAIVSVAWNAEDLARSTEALAAQVAANVPVCVATTDSDFFFGVDPGTGAVWLCEPGYPPIRRVADSLATFLSEIET